MSTKFPLISVIVPNYNHEKYLKKRLDSIFNQTYKNFEVILLDDSSTDKSTDILSEYAKRENVKFCVFNKENSGNTFVQWLKGIELSKGDFIWIAESDDYCDVDFLEKVSAPLLQDEEIMLSYCQSNKVDGKGNKMGNWIDYTNSLNEQTFKNDFIESGNLFISKFLIFKNVIPNASAVLLRKRNLTLHNDILLHNNLRTCGDWIIYFNQIMCFKVSFVAESLNNFRYHPNSVIAKVVNEEEKKTLIDINIKMRKVMLLILTIKKPLNYKLITSINNAIIKKIKYEKGMLLLRNNQKLKGFFVLIGVLDEFFKKYKFRKNLEIKLKRFIS